MVQDSLFLLLLVSRVAESASVPPRLLHALLYIEVCVSTVIAGSHIVLKELRDSLSLRHTVGYVV